LVERVLAIHAVNAGFSLLSSALGSRLSATLIERGVQVRGRMGPFPHDESQTCML
jgi:hypothetical protein